MKKELSKLPVTDLTAQQKAKLYSYVNDIIRLGRIKQ